MTPMYAVLTIVAVFTSALRRLWANAGLALCALIALLAVVALSVSIPVYAEAASLRLLKAELARQEQQNNRSAFALLFSYLSSSSGPVDWSRVEPVDAYLRGDGVRQLGLPLAGMGRHVRTVSMRLFLPTSAQANNPFLKNVSLGYLSGMDDYVGLVDGALPKASTGKLGTTPLEVLVSRELADEIGLNVGDKYSVVTAAGSVVSVPVVISGIWQAHNPADPAWFYPPSAFKDVILLPEASFNGPVTGALRNEVDRAVWFARLNGDQLNAAQAAPLLGRVEAVRARAAGILRGLKLDQSPAAALTSYRREAAALINLLFVFSVPILALVLYFAGLVASLLVNRQRGEIALLKTRGVRNSQILGMYIVEWLILGGLALLAGPPLGVLFATIMGRTQSFLQLSPDLPPLRLTLTADNIAYGVLAVAIAVIAALVPAAVATRRTLVDEQQQAARAIRAPFWQRFYLDILLLIPALYGLYQLRRGGLQLGSARGSDPFSNPLLVLVPVLLCFALGLVAVRIIPLILEVLARLAQIPSWVAPLVALRTLARQPGAYRGPLLLLVLTLSLASFSASMARTLDGALITSMTYRVGAPTQLIETGQSTERQPGAGGQPGNDQGPKDINEEARWLFVPVTDHLDVAGVTKATRIGSYEASLQLGGVNKPARMVGIDRLDFPHVVTHFDRRWADGQSLGALMNLLARTPEGVIVSRNTLSQGLKVGDTVPVQVSIAGDRREVRFVILAATDYWPGYYGQEAPFLIANLDYLFDQMGGQYPYDVWIARADDARVEQIVSGVRKLGITVVSSVDAATLIEQEQTRPQRQGLFGLLSVGFLAAGALTLLGFLLSALITSRRRAIELGVLRALGLGGAQVAVALVLEQLLLVAAGIGAGTLIGLVTAQQVVPRLQVKIGAFDGPPYPPQIAWEQVQIIYLVFGVALLLTLLALAWILGRMRLFQAVKLGDAN